MHEQAHTVRHESKIVFDDVHNLRRRSEIRCRHRGALLLLQVTVTSLPLQRQNKLYRLHHYRYIGLKVLIGYIVTVTKA
jgi:hypothetical protein